MLCICILGRFAPSVFTLCAHILGRFAPLAAFKFCLLYTNLWLPSNFACHTAAFGCLQALLLSSFACYLAAFGCLQALIAIQHPMKAWRQPNLKAAKGCCIASRVWSQPRATLYSAEPYNTQSKQADPEGSQRLLYQAKLEGSFACYKADLAAFKLCFLYSSLWLPSNYDCYTAPFGCLQALLVKQKLSTAYTAAFGCLQALLAIQQPLAAFKLCLLYSSLWRPSSFACYTAAFSCLQAMIATQQPLAAFKNCLLYSSLWLLSSFAWYTAAFGCLQALLDIQQP